MVVDAEAGWKLGPYDLIIANLTAEDLCSLMPRIVGSLERNGDAILSGILTSRELIVAGALVAADLVVTRRRETGEWVALAVARSKPQSAEDRSALWLTPRECGHPTNLTSMKH
jgi:ribosomal protein L11 methylase PrmA